MSVLDRISSPSDVRKLSMDELIQLAGEIRQTIVEGVAANGGHLASNLGVVELTLALHYVYDFGPFPAGPDMLLFDVGHQCYPHKMITGRGGLFKNLRKKGSVSGFPSPEESPYDLFAVGHAGTAISTAVGMARAGTHLKNNGHVVAMIGDASIVNGLSFEGLNNAGTLKRQLLMVLNDNGMSISRPQGAFSQYLERVRVSTTYDEFKRLSEKVVHRLPGGMQQAIEHAWHALCEGVKGAMWPGQIFETMGVKYMGPLDGHDLPGLINFLAEIKHVNRPVLLHVKTVKGHGFETATSEPTRFHSPAGFQVNGCRLELNPSTGRSWTTAFADAMIDIARQDPRVVALTAAMPDGTGLSKFEKEFPSRYYDTGICESHLTAMAAGMAKRGVRPVAAIYSTFIQRAFDQVWQEVSLNDVPVIFAMDRAGYVGDDGAVHHGFMDQAFLRPMPEMVLMAPSDESELKRALKLGLTLDGPSAVRYPRDNVPARDFHTTIEPELRDAAKADWTVGQSRVLKEGSDATLVVYGALAGSAMNAAAQLEHEGISVEVVDARFCKPVDGEMIRRVLRPGNPVLTLEDHALANGFGSAFIEYAVAHALPTANIRRLGMPDRLVAHATRGQQLAEVGLDAAGIARSIREAVQSPSAAVWADATGDRVG
ncbi:MAG: 1-deoxy-D-xylulose-5-phosphate synthase [Tepidisphaeraceae bacterium]|jgi:1-deoxy-D-xylulose-5-phosphate synthase